MNGRYSEVAKQIFLIVGVAGLLTVVAAAPGVLLVAKLFQQSGHRFPKTYKAKSAVRSLRGLQSNKLVEITEKHGKFEVRLTKKGRQIFKEIQLEKLQIVKPAHWDKKWRIVIFDIPDKSFRRARDVLREKLKEWDFYPLQKSVWVCPWPCEKEMQLVTELYGISRYVNIVIAEKIVDEGLLRKHFNL